MVDTAADNSGMLDGFTFAPEKPAATIIPPTPPTPPTPPVDPPIEKQELIPIQPEPPKPPDTPATPANEEEILKNIFGEGHPYKSFNDVKVASERLAILQKSDEEHVKLKGEYEKAKGRLSLMESPQYITATKFANFTKETGIEDFGVFRKLEIFDPAKMDDLQKVTLLEYVKYGDAGRSKEDIMQQYHLGDYAEPVGEEEVKTEKVSDQKALKREALEAEKQLLGFKQKINSYQPDTKDVSAEMEANKQAWAQAPDKMLPYFKGIDLPTFEKKELGMKVDVSYQFTPEDQAEIRQLIVNEIEANNMPVNAENVTKVYSRVMDAMYVRRKDQIAKLQGEKIWAAVDMYMKSHYSNWSIPVNGITPDRKVIDKKLPDGVTSADDLHNQMLKERGIRR